jgi:hypothetical protein
MDASPQYPTFILTILQERCPDQAELIASTEPREQKYKSTSRRGCRPTPEMTGRTGIDERRGLSREEERAFA